ncbi:MAG: NlpC/P60 family protein [Bacteroidota bacterium]
MDCSALTIHAFKSVQPLPSSFCRRSVECGREIKQKDLQPGDLVFFATGKRRRQVTHVGLGDRRKPERR